MQRFNHRADLNATRLGRPLLGYDWIAGILENEDICQEGDTTLQQISEFRRTNQAECVSTADIYEYVAILTQGCTFLTTVVMGADGARGLRQRLGRGLEWCFVTAVYSCRHNTGYIFQLAHIFIVVNLSSYACSVKGPVIA